MAATWRRCDSCRKVLASGEFDGDSATCAACGTKAQKSSSRAQSAPVTVRRTSAATPGPQSTAGRSGEAGAVRRQAPTGVVGRGDREVRASRARATALSRLAEMHPEDYERLLGEARRAEGVA